MSNRPETHENRILRMQRNGKAKLDAIETLELNGAELDRDMLRKQYKAFRQHRKAVRLLDRLRERQLAAFKAHMDKQLGDDTPRELVEASMQKGRRA